MALPTKYLLPSASELAVLSDATAKNVLTVIDSQDQRANAYAVAGLVCGTVSFLGCLASYVYLVMNNHDKAAGIVLGVSVLTLLTRMIRGR